MIHLTFVPSCPPNLCMMESDANSTDQAASRTQSLIGTLGDQNRYRLEREIGKGGMGEVFLAIDTRLNKQVALKLLSPVLVNSEAARHRFQQECAICAALKSPHVVQVSDYGITANGHPFYVMEYLQGETLRQLLSRSPQLAVEQVLSIVKQICVGLQVAHCGVVLEDLETQTQRLIKVIHRDLKPDNIFLVPTALGELVKVIDFGIAKIRLQEDYSEITQSLLGTSHYAAPEQFETAELDQRTDIYSLGIIFYEMLAGTDPYGLGFNHRPVSNTAWLKAHLTKPVLPLCSQTGCEQISPALEAVVLRCLAKSPAERFASVEALNQALQAVLTDNASHGVADLVDPAQSFPQVDQVSPAGQPVDPEPSPPVESSADRKFSFQTKHRTLPQALMQQTVLMILGWILLGFTIGIIVSSNPSLQLLSPPQQSPPAQTAYSLSKTLLGHKAMVWALALSPDQETLVSSDEAGMIKIWNQRTGQLERTLTGLGAVRTLSLSADEKLLASGGNKSIQIWEMQTGQLRTTYAQPAWAVTFSQDQKTLVSGSQDGLIRIWNLDSGGFRTLSGHQAEVYAVAISPDQKTIVSGSQDKTVKVWDMQTGALIHTFVEHQDGIRSIAFNAKHNLIASGSWDKTAKIWDLQTKTLVHTLKGHQDRVIAVAFSKDGRILASASRDKTIKLWDVQTGKLLQSLSGHADWVVSVEISSDGRTIVSGSRDQTIKIWQ